MQRALPQTNRFLVQPQYSLFFRQVSALDWKSEARSDYVLFALLRGAASFQTQKEAGELSAGEFLLLGPLDNATVTGRQVEVFYSSISPALVFDYAVRMRMVAPQSTIAFGSILVSNDSQLSQLTEGLTSELAADHPGREIMLAASVEQIVVHLLRHYANMRRSAELELSRVGLVDRRIRRAVELMHAHLDQDLSLKELASSSYLSPFHFSRLFKKLTGTTPHAYLSGLRTAQAQRLLAETDLSVTAIGSRVGYASNSHFTKAFRQATGLTPRAFRNSLLTRQS